MNQLERWSEEIDRYMTDGQNEYLCWVQIDGKNTSCDLTALTVSMEGRWLEITLKFEPEKAEKERPGLFRAFTKRFAPYELHPRGITRKELLRECGEKAAASVAMFFRHNGLMPAEKTLRLITAIEARGRFAAESYVLSKE